MDTQKPRTSGASVINCCYSKLHSYAKSAPHPTRIRWRMHFHFPRRQISISRNSFLIPDPPCKTSGTPVPSRRRSSCSRFNRACTFPCDLAAPEMAPCMLPMATESQPPPLSCTNRLACSGSGGPARARRPKRPYVPSPISSSPYYSESATMCSTIRTRMSWMDCSSVTSLGRSLSSASQLSTADAIASSPLARLRASRRSSKVER